MATDDHLVRGGLPGDDSVEIGDQEAVGVSLVAGSRSRLAVATCIVGVDTVTGPRKSAGPVCDIASGGAESVTQEDVRTVALGLAGKDGTVGIDFEDLWVDGRNQAPPASRVAFSITTSLVGTSSGPPRVPIRSTTSKPSATRPTSA